MSTKRVNIPKGIPNADAFNVPNIQFMVQPGKQTNYPIISKTRNGVVNVIRYVPLDIHPDWDKPEKFDETVEFHLVGDTVIRVHFVTVTSGQKVIDTLAKDIMDPSILAIRDAEGFVKLSYRFCPLRYWKANFSLNRSWPVARIAVIDTPYDDQVPTALANAIIALFDERVSIQYHTALHTGITTSAGQLVSMSKMLGVATDMLASMGVMQLSENVCAEIVKILQVPYDECY